MLAVLVAGLGAKSVTKSGLQVEVTKQAGCKDTRKAADGDKVTVHYGGFLQDGEEQSIKTREACEGDVRLAIIPMSGVVRVRVSEIPEESYFHCTTNHGQLTPAQAQALCRETGFSCGCRADLAPQRAHCHWPIWEHGCVNFSFEVNLILPNSHSS